MTEYTILIGNYGSGKTEIALNLALDYAREGKKTALVDLDIVNPYFRSSEHKKLLSDAGAELISPPYALSCVDLPIISAEVSRVFSVPYDDVIFDVGGDAVGATALGRYHEEFARNKESVHAYFVLNTCRPLAGSIDDILKMLDVVSSAARVPLTGIIHNTNLSYESTGALLLSAEPLVCEVERLTGLPVVYTAGTASTLAEYKALAGQQKGGLLELTPYTRPVFFDN